MKIVIPTSNGELSMHFGHCDQFTVLEVDPVNRAIIDIRELQAPPHEPGLLPRWLAEQGADTIIAGGMGQRAQSLFVEQGIEVVIGVPSESPDALARAYLTGSLASGRNPCDH